VVLEVDTEESVEVMGDGDGPVDSEEVTVESEVDMVRRSPLCSIFLYKLSKNISFTNLFLLYLPFTGGIGGYHG
jgi:hypothetical protein